MPAGILIFFWLNVLKHKIVEKILPNHDCRMQKKE